jgi:hypothetical protein
VAGAAARERLVREVATALAALQRVGVLALEEDASVLPPGVHAEVVGAWASPERSASHLFEALRSLDRTGVDILFARELADSNVGLGRALADRLRRAARRVLDSQD